MGKRINENPVLKELFCLMARRFEFPNVTNRLLMRDISFRNNEELGQKKLLGLGSKIKFAALISSLFLLIVSCSKPEGEGGTASIEGRVLVKICGADTNCVYASFMAQEEKVYIIYGDNSKHDDKYDTHYDGTYKFDFLRKGDYTLYAYSDRFLGNGQSEEMAIQQKVHISKNGEKKKAPLITIYKSVENYKGTSTVQGRLFAYDWNSDFTFLKDSFYVKNKYVYIARKMDHYYFERMRTYYDGSFVFPRLPIGEYEVYAYSRDIKAQDTQDLVPIIKEVKITENAQTIDVGRIDIIE